MVWDLVYNCSQDNGNNTFNYGNYNNIAQIIDASQSADMIKIGDWDNNPNKTVFSKPNTKPIIYFQNGIELSSTHNVDLGKITNLTNLTEWVHNYATFTHTHTHIHTHTHTHTYIQQPIYHTFGCFCVCILIFFVFCVCTQ